MCLSDDEKWQAVVKCDPSYDEKFLYVVKSVGVYCIPSCKSRTPLRKNVLYFDTIHKAEEAGFKPCKRCRPDIPNYAPVLELTKQTKELMDTYFHERNQLIYKMKQLGVSASHLSIVFKQQYGMLPSQYLSQIRLNLAEKLLSETNMSILGIAGEIGYASLPSFYSFFKKQTGMTPREYRKNITP